MANSTALKRSHSTNKDHQAINSALDGPKLFIHLAAPLCNKDAVSATRVC